MSKYQDGLRLLDGGIYLWGDRPAHQLTFTILNTDDFSIPSWIGTGSGQINITNKYDPDVTDVSPSKANAFSTFFQQSGYVSLFGNVANLDFSEKVHSGSGVSGSGDIVIGSSDVSAAYYYAQISEHGLNARLLNATTYFADKASDGLATSEKALIILNSGLGGVDNDLSDGSNTYWTLLHEIGHTLGLNEPSDYSSPLKGSELDNQRFTIMSYEFYAGMAEGLHPLGMQMYDIIALQELYGRRYDENPAVAGVQTVDDTYKIGQGFLDASSPFITTIWNGGGSDKIDASGYSDGVQIDLRQGHFSSIGLSGLGGSTPWVAFDTPASSSAAAYDAGNVAIAFHTVIENAIGTSQNDILIGNAWSNRLEGGNGNDTLYGSGEEYDGDRGFTNVDAENPDGYAPLSDDDTFVGGQGDDTIYGGSGSDTVDYSGDPDGVFVFLGEDEFFGGDGSFAYDGWDDTDTLRSVENIVGSGFDDHFEIEKSLGSSDRTFDGGAGSDVIKYRSEELFGFEHRVIFNEANGSARWTGATDTILNFESFENIILQPDLMVDQSFNFGNYGIVTNPSEMSQAVILSYAHSTMGGTFTLNSVITAEFTLDGVLPDSTTVARVVNGSVEIGGIEQYGVFDRADYLSNDPDYAYSIWRATDYNSEGGRLYGGMDTNVFYETVFQGTNFGDTINLQSQSVDANLRFITGTGNDTIYVGGTISHDANEWFPAKITYTGGSDSIIGSNGYITFANYIDPSLITISGNFDGSHLIGDGTITIAGYGQITINADGDGITAIDMPAYLSGNDDFGLLGLSMPAQTPTGTSNSDYIYGSAVADTLSGSGGDDFIYGDAGNDILYGGTGNDIIYGGIGNDTLYGGENANTLFGNTGNDTLIGGTYDDVLDGGDGIDTVSYADFTAVEADLSLTGWQYTYGGGWDKLASIENLIGSSYNDVLRGSNVNNSISGGLGYDIILGSAGVDILDGGGDYDEVSYFFASSGINLNLGTGVVSDDGMGSNDTLLNIEGAYGGAFADIMVGSASSDMLSGNDGNDTISGLAGNDALYGGAGDDTIYGGSGNDDLIGYDGDDLLEGGDDTDYIEGGNGSDTASYEGASSGVIVNLGFSGFQWTVGAGLDQLVSIENLRGSAYDDTLSGDNNDNIIDGRGGNNTLTGGYGADTFVFDASSLGNESTITDFNVTQGDKIDVSNLLFGFDPLQSAIDDYVILTASGSDTVIAIDRDGAGSAYSAQSVASISGVSSLDATTLYNNGNLIAA